MTGKVRFHERGSAIIMAVGLLVMLAMMGTTFFAITYLDRKDAGSIATAAPMKSVALGVLEQIRTERGKDLRFSATGGPYSAAANPQQAIDHAGEETDPMLASSHPFRLVLPGGRVLLWWVHLSNPGGDLADCVQLVTVEGVIASGPKAGQPIDQVDLDNDTIPDLDWVDTDGYGYLVNNQRYDGDAILHDSGVRDRLGRSFYVAVRVVDASALLNANLHHSPTPAGVGKPMPITDVSLEALLGQTIRDAVHKVRATVGTNPDPDPIEDYWRNYALSPLNHGSTAGMLAEPYKPFDISDMLALTWGGGSPSTASGRLFTALGTTYGAAKSFMTTHSAGRCLVPGARDKAQQKTKADLNSSDFYALYRGFYNLLAHLADPERAKVATQLAVNVIDFRDHEPEPPRVEEIVTAQSVAGTIVCGIERQPFITEAGYTLRLIEQQMPPVGYFGIELYNPYLSPIDLKGWKVKCGGAELDLTGNVIGPGGRLAIFSDGQVRVSTDTQAFFPGLDLRQEVLILRPSRLISGAPGPDALVGKVGPGDFNVSPVGINLPEPGDFAVECIQRCDTRTEALYSLALYKKGIQIDITDASSNLGKTNTVAPNDPDLLGENGQQPQPCPVYVRNGQFINVGELNRIFRVGPTADEPLDVRLTADGGAGCDPYEPTASNGRLSMYELKPTLPSGTPALPPGCLASDFFMVHSPRSDGYDNDGDKQPDDADEDIVYGFVNINTAPEMGLKCLPGLAGLSDDPPGDGIRSKVVQEILLYRDKLVGPYKTSRSTRLSMPNLREDPGFASPGEIAIPIRYRASRNDIVLAYRLPQNEYSGANQQPYNYTVAEADVSGNPDTTHDDGLPTALALRVNDDLVKRHVYYSWLSNHITVRSDVYIAYIRVDLRRGPQDAPLAVRRYAAVIDRSNCRTAADRPNVLMFAEIK